MDAAASFDPLSPTLIRLAYRMLGSVADAEDVTQEAFIRWLPDRSRHGQGARGLPAPNRHPSLPGCS